MSFDDEALRRERRRHILEFVGPLYVPGGRRFTNWKVAGFSRGGADDAVTTDSVQVAAQNFRLRRHLEVETSIDDRRCREHRFVGRLLQTSVPPDVRLPFSATVTERPLAVAAGRDQVATFRLLECGLAWIAFGPIGDRWVAAHGRGISAENLMLRVVPDIAALPESRWM